MKTDPRQQMPSDWDPAESRDAEWRGIASLMRAAEDVPLPEEEAFERVREVILAESPWEQPAAAKVVEVGPKSHDHDSFGAWAKTIVAGGGWGANLVRLAAVGAAAFALGGNWFSNDVAPPTQQIDPQVASVAMPTTPSPAAPARTVSLPSYWASLVEVDHASADIIPISSDTADRAMAGWASSVPAAQGYTLERSAYAADDDGWRQPSPAYREATGGRLLDLVQQLKFEILVRGDNQMLKTLTSLEEAMAPALATGSGSGARAETAAWLQQGSDLRLAGDYEGALAAFRQARRTADGSFAGFMAQIEIARLFYEDIRDYGSALEAYREALAQYPSHFLTPQFKSGLLERVELLADNQANDWAALDAWIRAQSTVGAERVDLLLEALSDAPSAPIAGQAALEAAELICDHPELSSNPEDLLAAFNEALRVSSEAQSSATIQFAMGLVAHQRMANRSLAQMFYTRALTLPGADEIAPRAEKLVQELRPYFAKDRAG